MSRAVAIKGLLRDIGVAELKHNVVGLARAAQVLGLPIVAATTARDSMWGPTIPELRAALGDMDIHDRSTVNAWDDAVFVAMVRQTGTGPPDPGRPLVRGVRVVAGHPCGTFSRHKRAAGLARLTAVGIEVSGYATLMVEVMADNADPQASDVYATLDMPFATLMRQVASGGDRYVRMYVPWLVMLSGAVWRRDLPGRRDVRLTGAQHNRCC